MPQDTDLSPYFSMRISPRVRYFAELATRITGVSLTQFAEDALVASFSAVSLDSLAEDGSKPIAYPLSAQLDNLWSEHPIIRLQLMSSMGYERHMSKDEKAIWAYLFTRPDLFNGDAKMDRRLITDQWEAIKAQALGKDGAK